MRIVIDGDACPSKDKIKVVAQKNKVPVIVYVDTAHIFQDDYFTIEIIGKGNDAVDFAIVNALTKEDILITQDYGLASMSLLKSKAVINPLGFEYTLDNIDSLLMKRHVGAKNRRAGKRGPKHKKRTSHNDDALLDLLSKLLS